MGFAENLREARRNRGFTQVQVATQLGIDKSTYCGYESGKRKPDVKRIRELAALLGVSTDSLIGYENPNYAPTYINRIDDRYLDALLNRPEITQLLDLALSTSTEDVWRMVEIWRLIQRPVKK